ncbi:replicative DNA helicase [Enorma phocaeensis]|uniref:Replicative DNA helicase n=1 Tax=Enorma phocaeensis TaxID=1871019 RepID=A0ABT7V9X1_9ACTN|nr:replicative DNA helicase [Enorma phocaeensis]MBM6952747.1 replicative DNA helicase [Enorma phocaeensis]MDM8275298.1 replicative DNA helicase [Enorma phocaeensis]
MDASTTEYGDYAWTPAGASDRGARQGLPNNAEAEANVLAAMILSPEVVSDAISELRPDDFYRPSHRTLFTAMIEMNERSIPVDSISLIDYLTSEGTLAQVGGEAYILELVGNTIALVNWQHHAGIVRRDSMLREIIGATNQINALAYDAPLDTKEVVERAESMLLSVTEREVSSSYKSLTEFMIEAYNEASEVCAAGGQAHGVPTGFPSLDRLLLGFREGQLIIIGARPAVGKTSFALNLALNAAAAGFTVGFFSLEMSGKEIAQRLICAHAMLSISDFRTGRITPEQWANINEATQELSKLDILIDDTPGTTVTEIRAKARRMLHNKEKAVIILDYLQLVSPPPGRRAENRAVEVSEMSRGLKIMAKDLEIPLIALSQLSRAVESRTGKRPQLSDLRESGSIEQDADIVMFLDRSSDEQEASRDDRPDEGVTRVIVAKNRSGPIGDVDLMFLPASTKFYELDGMHE